MSAAFAYHVSERTARDSIENHGIDAQRFGDDDYSGNWLWLDLSAARSFSGRSHDIWRVRLDGLDVSYETLIYADCVRTAANVLERISPEHIRRLP